MFRHALREKTSHTERSWLNSVPLYADHSLQQLMMTLPPNCKGWQTWIPHEAGEVASEGEFSTSTDLLLRLLFLGPVKW